MEQATEWPTVNRNGIDQLERTFKFRNFAEALAFTNKVGALAEQADHHPAILTEWGQVTITLWTHDVKGITEKDHALAAQITSL